MYLYEILKTLAYLILCVCLLFLNYDDRMLHDSIYDREKISIKKG